MTHLKKFLDLADQLAPDRREAELKLAAYEILGRLAEGERDFDIPIAYPEGPTWAYVVSTGVRRYLDTPEGLVEEMLNQPLELATQGEISDVLGPSTRS